MKMSLDSALNLAELQGLRSTLNGQTNSLSRAFIFACCSGVEWLDIVTLTWSQVRIEDEKCPYIELGYKRRDGSTKHYLSVPAVESIGERKTDPDRVFEGLEHQDWKNPELGEWASHAGIKKILNFEIARATFIHIMLMELGYSIYDVANLLNMRADDLAEQYGLQLLTCVKPLPSIGLA
ncbi:hypothetical protein [Marinobacterium aestuariivivens]|uniref:Tyr recombinase domain-containing protein n=1 Tax=Marinobacterium aestuariivivens TaxID=1698799 RepID=A0ABW2AA85_9GAMM